MAPPSPDSASPTPPSAAVVDNTNLLASGRQGALVAHFRCQKIGDYEATPLKNDIERLAPAWQWKIVADLSQVLLLGSQGIGMLVTLKKSCDANKGKLIICGLSDELLGLFKIAGITKLFVIKKDVGESLNSF